MSDFFAMEEIRSRGAWQAAAAELIATFSFVFLGAGAVVATVNILGETDPAGLPTGSGLLLIALAHGLGIALLVAAVAQISGGHINPAVTVSMMATRKIGLAKGVMYIVGQLAGAALGAYLLMAVIPDASEGTLGAHALAGNIDAGTGLVIEALLTFFLVFVIFATAVDPKGPSHLAPIAIGLIVLVDHFMGVPLTGASMNPARSFGPALAAGEWADHWVYWVGPIVGGIIAAVLYEMVFIRWRTEEASEGASS